VAYIDCSTTFACLLNLRTKKFYSNKCMSTEVKMFCASIVCFCDKYCSDREFLQQQKQQQRESYGLEDEVSGHSTGRRVEVTKAVRCFLYHQRHLVYRMHAVSVAPPEDEKLMLETCRGS
jgi:hypothetical protein